MTKFRLSIDNANGKVLAENDVILRTKFNYRIDRGFKNMLEKIDLAPYSGQSLLGHVKYLTPHNDVFFKSTFKINISDDKSVSSIERTR